VLLQATRGTFGSGGHFRPFTSEQEDGLATLAWVRAQPWCDGRVATTGASYLGHTQWAVAPYADPPPVCVSLHVTGSRISDRLFYDHGTPNIHTALTWSASIGKQERAGLPRMVPRRRIDRALERLPLQAVDVDLAGAPVEFWRDFTAHDAPGDPFWVAADHQDADLSRMPPVNMVTGWWDLFLAAQLEDHARLRAAGVPVRLQIGPWLHGEPAELKASLQSDAVWLDHHLRGGPAPTGATVRVHLQQAGTWLDLETWPPPSAHEQVQFLHPAGALDPQPAGDDVAPSRFTYDPADPTPTVGGPLLRPPGKQAENAAVEARPDVLVFTGPPLARDLDVVGPVRARVHLRTTLEHADVFVRLCDVDPEGRSLNVVDGIRRLSPQTVPAPDVEVGEDGVRAVDVELFPTAYRVRAGHRLRVQVSGGAFPRYARNPGTGEPFATATGGVPCGFEVLHDAAHPSRVVLSVL
jgi:putative CocE/NonD family hydrolase